MAKNDLGNNIKRYRNDKGLSLTALAKQANISKGYLLSIESGNVPSPSVYVIAAIADVLEIGIEALIVRRGVTGYMRGHAVWYDYANETWRYMDNDKPFDDSRTCPKCGELPTTDGHDACIGHIKGAKSVCCGHGIEDGYIVWD